MISIWHISQKSLTELARFGEFVVSQSLRIVCDYKLQINAETKKAP